MEINNKKAIIFKSFANNYLMILIEYLKIKYFKNNTKLVTKQRNKMIINLIKHNIS